MCRLRALPQARELVVDQCSFGARWRKRTRLVGWWTPILPRVNRLCHGRGICCSTNRPHLVLVGKVPGSSVNWTTLAAQ
eukprot:304036-Pyramimonas_sp.AAC.1